MAQVGVLAVSVVANSQQFKQGLKDAGKTGKTFSVGMSKQLAGLAKGFLGLAAATKAWRSLLDFAKQADSIAKLADELGVSTDAMQQMQHAAELTGVGNFNVGIEKMVDGVGEAARGTGEAAKALEELGLDAQELVQLRPDQQLNAIADAMVGIQNTTRRLNLARDIFGRSGAEMVNLLKGGSAAIKQMGDELRRDGGIINEGSLRKAEKFNDTLLKQQTTWRALKGELAEFAFPIVTGFIDDLKTIIGLLKDIGKLLPDIGGNIPGTGSTSAAGGFADLIRLLKGEPTKLNTGEGGLVGGTKIEPVKELEEVVPAVKKFKEVITPAIEAIEVLEVAAEDTAKAIMDLGDPFSANVGQRGSQAELRARFETTERRKQEQLAREALAVDKERNELLRDLLARTGVTDQIVVEGFSF